MFVMFNCVFVTSPCGILRQVWYLIVSIPDIRPFLTFFDDICTLPNLALYEIFKINLSQHMRFLVLLVLSSNKRLR